MSFPGMLFRLSCGNCRRGRPINYEYVQKMHTHTHSSLVCEFLRLHSSNTCVRGGSKAAAVQYSSALLNASPNEVTVFQCAGADLILTAI